MGTNLNQPNISKLNSLNDDLEVQTSSIYNHDDSSVEYDDIRKNFWDEIRDEKINGFYNLEFKEDNTLKGASLVKIIEFLTSPDEIEPNFLDTFLHTYRSFTTPEILLQKLIERFKTPEQSPYKDKTQKEWEAMINLIKIRTGIAINKVLYILMKVDYQFL